MTGDLKTLYRIDNNNTHILTVVIDAIKSLIIITIIFNYYNTNTTTQAVIYTIISVFYFLGIIARIISPKVKVKIVEDERGNIKLEKIK